ncbi:MAG: SCO family protein [Alphaproteobacteria bacterium]|jgi:cytochrome oxidase Cu insertion factor (SCO1/SenC/PrrC family)|nr:MAG: SCO family protein [Alphaproteobacteria bacterium]
MRSLRLALYIFAGFWFGALAAFTLFPAARERLLPSINVRSAGQALVGGPFTLIDHTGKRVTDQDFRGKFLLVFFGFTNCPDVCPTALQVMAAALDKLGPNAARITPVLISVDPAHDTPAVLATYVASFHPRLVGLTGSQAEIDAVAKAYRVYVKKVPDPKSTAGYTMDHSSIIYVMGPDGSYRAHFTHATSPDVMAERLSGMLQRPTM